MNPHFSLFQEALQDALTYEAYLLLMQDLVQQSKSTGVEQSDALSNYTLLNYKRMQRLNKTLKIGLEIGERISKDRRNLKFLVLTESWCGDAAQSIPMVSKICGLHKQWSLHLISRDAHPALMDQFLTNGARSIPKVLILDANTLSLVAHWGPRPRVATQMVVEYKATHGSLDAAFKQSLQLWYNKDKGQSTLLDFMQLLDL